MGHHLIGTVSSGTLRPEDLVPCFADVLGELDTEDAYLALRTEAQDIDNLDYEVVEGVLEDLFDALNELAPPGTYFGAHPGNGSDFGFWEAV